MSNPNTSNDLIVGIDIPRSTEKIRAESEKILQDIRDLKLNIQEVDVSGLTEAIREALQEACKAASPERLELPDYVPTVLKQTVDIIKEVYQAVYDIDTAMAELYRVTDETEARYQRFLQTSLKNAEESGRSVSSLIKQSAGWVSSGFSMEESETLAKASSVYANITDTDDISAVSDLAAAMKAFHIEAENAISVIDPLYRLENEFSASSGKLGTGLQRAASAMADAGTDLNQTLAMLAGGARITQNAGTFGDFLKTGSLRIRGMKEELEALGEETDDSIRSVGQTQAQVLSLTHGNVNILDESGELKSYYKIMEDIAAVYDKLTSSEQASLSGLLFGNQWKEQGSALIQSFQSGQVQEAYEAAVHSAGSAYEEQARWMDSLKAKTEQFQAAFQSLSDTILSSDLAKSFTDLGTSGISSLDTVMNKIGSMNTLSMIGGGLLGAGNLG